MKLFEPVYDQLEPHYLKRDPLLPVRRDRGHHHHGRHVQRPRHPQHLDVPAQDEDGQFSPHQEPLHRRPDRGLRRSASSTSGHGQGRVGLRRCHVQGQQHRQHSTVVRPSI